MLIGFNMPVFRVNIFMLTDIYVVVSIKKITFAIYYRRD